MPTNNQTLTPSSTGGSPPPFSRSSSRQQHSGKRNTSSSMSKRSATGDQSVGGGNNLSANEKSGAINLNSSMLSETGAGEFSSINYASGGTGGIQRTSSMLRRVKEAAVRGGLLAQQKQTAAQSAIANAKQQQTQILLPPKVVEKLKETFHEHHDRIDDFWGVHAILTEHCNLQVSPVLLSRIIHEQGLSRPQQQQKERQRKLQQLQQQQQAHLQQLLGRSTVYQNNKINNILKEASTISSPSPIHRASVAALGTSINSNKLQSLGIAGPVIDPSTNLPPIPVISRTNSIADDSRNEDTTTEGLFSKSLSQPPRKNTNNNNTTLINEYSGTVKHTADEPAVQLDEDSFVLLAQTIAFDERYDEEFRSDDRSLVNIAVSESVPEIAKQHHYAQQQQPQQGGPTSTPGAPLPNMNRSSLPLIAGGNKDDINSFSTLSSTRAHHANTSPFVATDAQHLSAMALDHFLCSFDLQSAIDDLAPKDYLASKRDAANVRAAIVASTQNLGNNTSTAGFGQSLASPGASTSAGVPMSLALHSFTSRISVNTVVPPVVDQAIDLDLLYKKLNVKDLDNNEANVSTANGGKTNGASAATAGAGKSALSTAKNGAASRKGTLPANTASTAIRNPLVRFGALPIKSITEPSMQGYQSDGTSVLFNTAASTGTATNRFKAPVDDATLVRMDNAQLEKWLAYGVGDNDDANSIGAISTNNSYSTAGSGFGGPANKHNNSSVGVNGDQLELDGGNGNTDSLGHTGTFQRASEVLGGLPSYPTLEAVTVTGGEKSTSSQPGLAFGKRSQSFRGKPNTSNMSTGTQDNVSLFFENARKTLATTGSSKLNVGGGGGGDASSDVESSQTPTSFRSPSTQPLQSPAKKPPSGKEGEDVPSKLLLENNSHNEKEGIEQAIVSTAVSDPAMEGNIAGTEEEIHSRNKNVFTNESKTSTSKKQVATISSTRRARRHSNDKPWRTGSKAAGDSNSKSTENGENHSPYHHKKRPLVEASTPTGGWRSHLRGANASDTGGHHHISNPAHDDPFYDYSTSDLQELRPFVSATVQKQIDEVLHARQETALRDLLASDTDGADKSRGCVFTEETALRKAKVIPVPYQKKVTSKINDGSSPTAVGSPLKDGKGTVSQEITSKQLQSSVMALNKTELENEKAAQNVADNSSSVGFSPTRSKNFNVSVNEAPSVEDHAIDPQMLRWVSSSKKPVSVTNRR